jgi:hypothetical protein
MELLALHDQCVTDLPANDQDHDVVALDIVQDAEVADPKFKGGERIGPELLDRRRRRRRPVAETSQDGRLQRPLLAGGQTPLLRLSLLGDLDTEGHVEILDWSGLLSILAGRAAGRSRSVIGRP